MRLWVKTNAILRLIFTEKRQFGSCGNNWTSIIQIMQEYVAIFAIKLYFASKFATFVTLIQIKCESDLIFHRKMAGYIMWHCLNMMLAQ